MGGVIRSRWSVSPSPGHVDIGRRVVVAGRDPAERAGAVAPIAAVCRVRVLVGLQIVSPVAVPGERPDRGLRRVPVGLEVVPAVAVVVGARDAVAAAVALTVAAA